MTRIGRGSRFRGGALSPDPFQVQGRVHGGFPAPPMENAPVLYRQVVRWRRLHLAPGECLSSDALVRWAGAISVPTGGRPRSRHWRLSAEAVSRALAVDQG